MKIVNILMKYFDKLGLLKLIKIIGNDYRLYTKRSHIKHLNHSLSILILSGFYLLKYILLM